MAAPVVAGAIKVAKTIQTARAMKTAVSGPQKPKKGRWLVWLAVLVVVGIWQVVPIVQAVATVVLAITTAERSLGEEFCAADLERLATDYDDNGNLYTADAGATLPTSSGAGGAFTVSDPSARVVMPVPEGRYRLASPYGWRTHPVYGDQRFHSGLDFSAIPRGALDVPILSVADGVVERTGSLGGLGHIVVIKHNIGGTQWVSVYGHLQANSQTVQPGQSVVAGQQVGLMGTTGTSTGVHLHFEVWTPAYGASAGGRHMDPAVWLQSAGAVKVTEAIDGGGFVDSCGNPQGGAGGAGPWGGHENGKIPASEMCAPPSFPGHLFRCDAASAFEALNAAFKAEFGRNLNLTDSYRSYEGQVACRADPKKGHLCAVPGTSNHGWGLAADVGITSFTSAEYRWMAANASRFSWVAPAWAQQAGSKPEPWHWEFAGGGAAAGDGKTPESAKALAQAQMASYGWNADEFNQCLVPLWTKESNWNYQAANPSSSARGIPQAMMSAHWGSGWQTNAAAQAWMSDPSQQITWGLTYIKNRYGTPCAAWSHSQKTGWY